MSSIQRRLGLVLAGSLVLVGLGLMQSSVWLFEAGLRRDLAVHLEAEAQVLLLALVPGADGLTLEGEHLNPRYRQAFSGHYFQIETVARQWRSRSLWDASPDWPGRRGLADDLLGGPRGQRLLAYRGEFQRDGQHIVINVAQDYTPILDSFVQVRLAGFGLVALALLVLLVLLRYALRQALAPLERARQQIVQLRQGERQTLDPDAPDELQPLVAQINHLLGQTDATLRRSRHALGNLGHALKTPLAVLGSLARRDELAAQPTLQGELLAELARIDQRLSRELGRARLAGEALPGHFFACGEDLDALLATLRAIHRPSLELHREAPAELRLPWDREDMQELLGNLLDNACKWARQRVEVRIERNPDGYCLQVDDDGPGIPEARRADASRRGIRLDEQPPGHGLGLGIVDDIVSAWGGRWGLEQSPLGGLRVRVELPG